MFVNRSYRSCVTGRKLEVVSYVRHALVNSPPAFQIYTKATPHVEVWQTSNLRPLRLGEEKKEEEETTG